MDGYPWALGPENPFGYNPQDDQPQEEQPAA